MNRAIDYYANQTMRNRIFNMNSEQQKKLEILNEMSKEMLFKPKNQIIEVQEILKTLGLAHPTAKDSLS